jgi:hypothetical protein
LASAARAIGDEAGSLAKAIDGLDAALAREAFLERIAE